MAEEIASYEAAVSYLDRTPRFTEKHTIAQTKRFLALLDDPERAFRVIHVAGSNGKGSVCASLSSILGCAGISCGLFTSPHLVTTRERIRINGEMISEAQFLEDFREVADLLAANPQLPHPTYFEYLFLMAMLRFRKAGVEAAVLETGLGGRLDATNAVEKPDVCVITSICLDHTEYLGETIPRVAAEKAGIIKEGIPVFYDGTDEEAAQVIAQKAGQMHAPSRRIRPEDLQDVRAAGEGIAFRLQGMQHLFRLQIPYPAEYQVMNAALAACAGECFLTQGQAAQIRPGKDGVQEAVETGIARCAFPGRMEKKPGGIYLDGAHNPAGIQAFLKAAGRIGGRGQTLVFACMKDKNVTQMVQMTACSGLWDRIIVTGTGSGRSADPQELAALFRTCTEAQVYCVSDPAAALEKAKEVTEEGRYIFAAGSLYLVGGLERIL